LLNALWTNLGIFSHNMPDHSNLDPRLVSSFPTVKTGPVWGRHNEKKKKDSVCVTVPFNIECAACHHRMNKVRSSSRARARSRTVAR